MCCNSVEVHVVPYSKAACECAKMLDIFLSEIDFVIAYDKNSAALSECSNKFNHMT